MLLYVDLLDPKHRDMFDWLKPNGNTADFYLEKGHTQLVLDDATDTVHISLMRGKFTMGDAIPIDQVTYAFDPSKRFFGEDTQRPFLTSACYISPGLDHDKIPTLKDALKKQGDILLGPIGKLVRDCFSKLFDGPDLSIQEQLGPTIAEVRNNPKLLLDYEA